MWYKTEEEAEKAYQEKEKEFKKRFKPMKDSEKDIWWAQRVLEEQ